MNNPIKLSRSRLELFLECPQCFWLLMNKNISRPPSYPYAINQAIDGLLKKEFDQHRKNGTQHEVMKKYKINAIPFSHPEMDNWRNKKRGVQFEHTATGFLVYGAVDDIWVEPSGKLIVVDYKATGAKETKIYDSYKRQMEVYQWLLEKNGFKVSSHGYFFFAQVDKEAGFHKGKLSFDLTIEPCEGDISWIEDALKKAKNCLENKISAPNPECEFCKYKQAA